MSHSIDDGCPHDESLERALFAHRADLDAQGTLRLDVDDVLARIDHVHEGSMRRARVFGVARVVTLANAFAAAAAFFALMRGLPVETNVATNASDEGPNMSVVGASSEERSSMLACLLAGGMSGGEPMCFARTMPSGARMQTSMSTSARTDDEPRISLSSRNATFATSDSLSCIDEVTCGVVGP